MSDTLVVARLNAKLGPLDRFDYFEDPLTEALEEKGSGLEVCGGGTALAASGEIDGCDVEIAVPEATPGTYDLLAALLEEMGAPKGSKLFVEGEEVKSLGQTEGLAVYLNGHSLPEETYANCDINFVAEEFERLLGDQCRILSSWAGPTETALYVYGPSFDQMHARLESFLASYPLCERCRVVRLA